MSKKIGKRMLTWCLVLVMALTLLPGGALAADELVENGCLQGADINNGLIDGTAVQNALDDNTAAVNSDDGETEETLAQVAQIGEEGPAFSTLAEAIAAANEGDEVHLLTNTTENIEITKAVTLDLGGNTLDVKAGRVIEVNIVEANSGAMLTIKNGIITGGCVEKENENKNGGGIYIKSAHRKSDSAENGGTLENIEVRLDKLKIKDNHADWGGGGGVYIAGGNVTFKNCELSGNSAGNGGGVYCQLWSGDPSYTCTLIDTTVSDNVVTGSGGGFATGSSSSNETVMLYLDSETKILRNKARLYGGGLYLSSKCTRFEMRSGEISYNEVKVNGGGIWCQNGVGLEIKSGYIIGNKATNGNPEKGTSYGGGIYIKADNKEMKDKLIIDEGVVIKGNYAKTYGGGIYADSFDSVKGIDVKLKNALVYDNTAGKAGDDLVNTGKGEEGSYTYLAPVGTNWKLTACGDEIDGWYYDTEAPKEEEPSTQAEIISSGRWNAHPDKGAIHVEEFTPKKDGDSGPLALKAAHAHLLKLTYEVSGDIPDGYTAPAKQTLAKGVTTCTVAGTPESISGTKDGVRGTYSFTGWKDAAGNFVTGELKLTEDTTLYGVWTFRRSYRPNPPTPTVEIPDEDALGLNTDDHFAYIIGYPDGTVQPNGQITRAEATTIFFRLLTDESREQFWSTNNVYPDVKAGQWYNNAISTMTKAGIVDGYPDGTFCPDAPITRAEMAKIISLFAKLDKSESRFSDIAGHWAEAYIKLAAGNGWIEGYPDGTFGPQRNITRAETATMINRVLERVPSAESRLLSRDVMQIWPDSNPGDWFYLAMQEATNSHDYERNAKWAAADEQWTALRETRDWKALEK